jgi:hypothetical protein
MLISQATGESANAEQYKQLRLELLASPRLKAMLPTFIRSCRDLGAFWSFIKSKFAHYEERRQFLRSEFDPTLAALESEILAPSQARVSQALAKLDSEHAGEAWQKALDRTKTDPQGAITAARSLVESVCKLILDQGTVAYKESDDLPKLYALTASQLNLAPGQHTQQVFKQILGGCQSVVEGLGALRNKLSDAHGKGRAAVKPAPRHAELAVNLAGSMVLFLISTWEARKWEF